MVRGMFGGALVGVAAAAAGLAVASIMAPPPERIEAPLVDDASTERPPSTSRDDATRPVARPVPAATSAPDVLAMAPALATDGAPLVDAVPAAPPAILDPGSTLGAPPESREVAVEPVAEPPVRTALPGVAPQLPGREAAPQSATAPARPGPETETTAYAPTPAPPAVTDAIADIVPVADGPELNEADLPGADAPADPQDATPLLTTSEVAPRAEPVIDRETVTAPLVPDAPRIGRLVAPSEAVTAQAIPANETPALLVPSDEAPGLPVSPGPDAPPLAGSPAAPTVLPQADPPVAALPEDDAPGQITLDGGRSLPGGASGDVVPVNRPGEEPALVTALPDPAETEAAKPAEDAPALVRYAAAFEPQVIPRPLVAVLLIDDGTLSGAEEAVAALPFPVSIVLDPAREGAAEAMASWRARGFEVLALASLPEGAQPVDVAVNLEAMVQALPEAVAFLDLGGGGLGGGGAVEDQILARLAEDGRGAVMLDEGLGMGLRAAAGSGVPAASVLRDLDGDGQDDRVIRRFLDDAARRAGQEGQVVLLGRVRPETLTALALWGSARRAQEVTMAPLSAVLGAEGG